MPNITVGIPVYNGEKFIRKRIENLLSQTFKDFEIIISDNASTDATAKICQEYAKKDKRIRYIQQGKKIGQFPNFYFLLDEAKCKYFVWASVDDIWGENFLEKNHDTLESNENIIGSMSKIGFYNSITNSVDVTFENFKKKLRRSVQTKDVNSITGPYSKKVRFYLKNSTCSIIYSLYRTEVLRKSVIHDVFNGCDWSFNLNVLRSGDLHVVNEILFYKDEGGETAKGIIAISHLQNKDISGKIFPWLPFTKWCRKNLGLRIFLKNLDFFIQLNLEGVVSQVIDLTRIVVHIKK